MSSLFYFRFGLQAIYIQNRHVGKHTKNESLRNIELAMCDQAARSVFVLWTLNLYQYA